MPDSIHPENNNDDAIGDDAPDERAFDALLIEAMGTSEPPDLTFQILSRLRQEPVATARTVRPIASESPASSQRRSSKGMLGWCVALAALAASVVGIVWMRGNHSPAIQIATASQDASNETSSAVAVDIPPKSPVPTDATGNNETGNNDLLRAPRTRPEGIPMTLPVAVGDTPSSEGNPLLAPEATRNPGQWSPLPAITWVAQRSGNEMLAYWAAIGIRPADQASDQQVIDRVKRSSGIELSIADLANAKSIQERIATDDDSKAVAGRWLAHVTDGGIDQLSPENRSRLVNDVAKSFAGQSPLDHTVAQWIDGRGESSSAFYTAMAGSSKSVTDGVLARRLASLTLNADLRCTRCHDSYIEGSGRQADYWSLVGLLDQSLVRNKNQWTVTPSAPSKPLFYDLIDGRRRVATAGVPGRWLAEDDATDSLADWSSRLVGSPQLATGIVNSLWEMVHGQPLRGRVVDPMNAPHNDALSSLESFLVDDLRNSNFDLGRSLALILASPANNRAVPQSLEDAWVIENAEAKAAAEAFAAALPEKSNLPLTRRLDEAMRAIGAKLGDDGKIALAQIGENGVKGPKVNADSLSWDFPDRAQALPVQWLLPIEDSTERARHLAYLAGLNELPKPVERALSAMKAAAVDETTLQTRVWWMVK
ncbi:hypothetical protein [Rubripirellula tenax]|nr:hypothetical protein [Rubripirellula tenax]